MSLVISKKSIISFSIVFFSILFSINNTLASSGIHLLRDAEIENFLQELIRPILISSNIPEDRMKIHIVSDSSINAFATLDSNIFVYTGLIQQSESYTALQGVLAHEIGHVSLNHLIRITSSAERAQFKTMLLGIIGAATLLVSGSASGSSSVGQAALGMMLLQRHILTRKILSFSRGMEREADNYAIKFLQQSYTPHTGLVQILTNILMQQRRTPNTENIYMLSHPLSQKRIEFINSQFVNRATPSSSSVALQAKFENIQGKLAGYLSNKTKEAGKLLSKNSEARKYKKGIHYIVKHHYKKAEKIFFQLTSSYPQNPYYHELLAEVYTAVRNIEAAELSYQKSIELSNGNSLINFQYAIFLASLKRDYERATKIILNCISKEPENTFFIGTLIKYYTKNNQPHHAKLYSILRAILLKKTESAKRTIYILERNLKRSPLKNKETQSFFKMTLKNYKERIKPEKKKATVRK